MRHDSGRRSARVALGRALFALSLSTGCHQRGPVEAVTQTSRASVAGPLSTAVVAPGIVEPWGEEVRVAAKEAGWIAEIKVREGQRVEAGELLARLEDGAQAVGVALATADVAELEALLTRHGWARPPRSWRRPGRRGMPPPPVPTVPAPTRHASRG